MKALSSMEGGYSPPFTGVGWGTAPPVYALVYVEEFREKNIFFYVKIFVEKMLVLKDDKNSPGYSCKL